jgi:hypothetical protein
VRGHQPLPQGVTERIRDAIKFYFPCGYWSKSGKIITPLLMVPIFDKIISD